jgi:sugar phosphate isomerase/epimerase
MNRRDFLSTATLATAGLVWGGCQSSQSSASRQARPRIAFNTANLVGRVSGYRYELRNWGEQHQKTVAATDEAAWDSICADIAAAGYRAVEIWEAHAAPESLTAAKAKTWRNILDGYKIQPIGYAGGLRRETLNVCHWLGIADLNGGLRGQSPEAATALCRAAQIRFNYENHPEKTVEEILRPIGGGNEWLGVCIDTGWLGTQGASSPETIRALRSLVRHTHIKDVRRAGTHETCRLGDGIVNIPAVLTALQGIGYSGWYAWEDEPEDRNPLDLARWTREYLSQRV